jgi:hypothetical protein
MQENVQLSQQSHIYMANTFAVTCEGQSQAMNAIPRNSAHLAYHTTATTTARLSATNLMAIRYDPGRSLAYGTRQVRTAFHYTT